METSLWKPRSNSVREQQKVDYKAVYLRYAKRPRIRPFFRICAAAVVVVQEVAMTSYLFLRHRVTLSPTLHSSQQRIYMDASTVAMLIALVTAVLSSTTRQNRLTKAATRAMDACLLAVLLRFISSVLHSLTASYSSDTVTSLAVTLLILHVLMCDYSYANGYGSGRDDSGLNGQQQQQQRRPPFLGGTVALNAALSATTLLTSRQDHHDLSSYAFLGLAVLLFGLYPMTRHSVASTFPAHQSPVLWLITAPVCVADVLLLLVLKDDDNEHPIVYSHEWILVFALVVISLLLVIPAYKCFWMQHQKVVLRGPWDIPKSKTMQLDHFQQ